MSEYANALEMPSSYVDMNATDLEYGGAGLSKIGKYATIISACVAGAGLVAFGLGLGTMAAFGTGAIATAVSDALCAAGTYMAVGGAFATVASGIFWGEAAAFESMPSHSKGN